jgi:ABC-type multidrug transport system fused ATPase/permease subunit
LPSDPDLPPQGDPDRELAARRKQLERDFDDKLRDLKAQHKRQADKLQQDRADWEEHKRRQAKELADKAEKVRKAEENARRAEGLKASERKEMADLRQRNKDLEAAALKLTATRTKLEERVSTARGSLAPARSLLTWFGILAVLAPVTWLAFAWQTAGRPALVVAAAALVAGLLLNAWRWRIDARQTRG